MADYGPELPEGYEVEEPKVQAKDYGSELPEGYELGEIETPQPPCKMETLTMPT